MRTSAVRKRRPCCRTTAGMRGVAMMDVITGAALMGIIVVGTIYFFTYEQRQTQGRARERGAYDLARNRIEEIIAAGYDKAVSRIDSGLTLYGGTPAIRTTTVTYVDDPADSLGIHDKDGNRDYKDIVVEVEYLDKIVTVQTSMYP